MNNIDEDFYYEESNPKKVFLHCLIILFVLGTIIGAFYYFRTQNTTRTLTVTIELGDQIPNDISVFMRGPNLETYRLDVANIPVDEEGNTNSVGEYSFRVISNYQTLRGRVYIVDTTPPTAEVHNLIIGLEEIFEAEDFLISCFDLSGACFVEFANESYENLNETLGTHNLSIIISDRFDNSITKEVTLTVNEDSSLSNLRANDLEASHIYPNDPNWNNTFTFRFERGMFEDNYQLDDYFLEIANADLSSRFDQPIRDTITINIYNKHDFIIGLVVRVDFTDGTRIYLENIE